MKRTLRRVVLGVVSLLVAGGDVAHAAKLAVAVNGVDSGGCGAAKDPCRTITRAIANAGVGDTIVVGPGRYGDVSGDGSISGPEEEQPNVDGCGCLVSIGKRVTIVSRDGASATTIAGGNGNRHVVRISTDGVQFGKKNQGFTVSGAAANFAAVDVASNGNTVAGNILIGNGTTGYRIEGSMNVVSGSRLSNNGGDAVLVSGSDNLVTDTVVTNSGQIGFNIGGNRNALRGVVANGNLEGIGIVGSGHTVTASETIGNIYAGVDIANGDAVVSKTTIVDNSVGGFIVNCGVAVANSTITATGNYWGAPTGPGADPADDVCITSGSATTAPFATKEFKVSPKPVR